MLGPAKPRRLDQPIAVSLEDLVPKSNVYRLLEAKLGPSVVREWARELYAERGRPSIDPVDFFTLCPATPECTQWSDAASPPTVLWCPPHLLSSVSSISSLRPARPTHGTRRTEGL